MLRDKVAKGLNECICVETEDNGNTIGLPYPYSVPTPGTYFHSLYYWDTYFINIGHICTGNVKQAKYNVDDMLHMVERFGFMPNGSRMNYLSRSQPPFLSIMARDVYEAEKDKEWLKNAYATLKKEYKFWKENRTFENGLSHYGYNPESDSSYKSRYEYWVKRTRITTDMPSVEFLGNYLAQCESGWDFTPRFGLRAQYIACPDLNSLLWKLEDNMAYFAEELNNGEAHEWQQLADARKQKINELIWQDDVGSFVDFDNITHEKGSVFSVAAYYPMFVGLASKEQAQLLRDRLPELEHEYGVCPCAEHTVFGRFQWDSPNIWPCLQWIMYKALKNYGFDDDADRVAQKYIALVESVEAKTGELWEKYNGDTGYFDLVSEYTTPSMFGWAAGVYLKLLDELKIDL